MKVDTHPAGLVQDIVVTPGELPITNPEEELMLAMLLDEEDQIFAPPDAVKVVDDPWHMLFEPVMIGVEFVTGRTEFELLPQEFDAETEILPLLAPKLTVTELVPFPEIIVEPDGIVQL